MPKRINPNPLKRKILIISKKNYERILMWSMSEKEIRFICLGTGNSVQILVRLRNVARNAKNYCLWSEKDRIWSVNRQAIAHHQVICYGHSHPSIHHNKHPSETDVKYSITGQIELIAFPHLNVVCGWVMSSTVAQTKMNEVEIKIQG